MITVDLTKKQNIVVSGHANAGSYGSDIVCASVSTAIIVILNIVEKLDLMKEVSFDIKEGYADISYQDEAETSKIMETLIEALMDLANQYPKKIKIIK